VAAVVRLKVLAELGTKVATTDWLLLMVRLQEAVVPEQAPAQSANLDDPVFAVAVSVTAVPEVYV
jgi:hypothetical protein